jgi:hypothetical protein
MVNSSIEPSVVGDDINGAYVQPSPGYATPVTALVDGSGNLINSANAGGGTADLAVSITGGTSGVAQASTTSAQVGPLIQGATTTANPTYVTAKTNPLSLDLAGNLRVKPYQNSTITAQVGAVVSAPAASATVASVTPGTAGLWEIQGTVSIAGTTVAAADSNNMRLRQAGTNVLANIPIGVQSTTGANGVAQFGPLVLNLSAVDTVNIIAVGNATASSVYGAQIVARLIG